MGAPLIRYGQITLILYKNNSLLYAKMRSVLFAGKRLTEMGKLEAH